MVDLLLDICEVFDIINAISNCNLKLLIPHSSHKYISENHETLNHKRKLSVITSN